ncbi:DUF349 domain-containing protein [Arundinibacter roseus]|uniref:DUF349 domain-containing protein n=1 Tax=Arundinibacter roseus TaxID=2070510 RepID=A0A4R4KHB7_9BACT|nr:DUF349 domain-containing protein [Arundinibacter roseus]TDB65979.1 DUF349 domain-containing protein [Arundinibacter roseus]
MENAQQTKEYGYVEDGKVFLKGYLDYPARQIGEVKRTEQEAIDYFKNRFTIAESKVALLESEVQEAQNKGSYLTKLLQLRRKLIGFDAIGDFIPLLERLDKAEAYLSELIHSNQLKNLEIKRALIEDAKVAAAIEDWQVATDALQEVKSKWIRTGPVDKEFQDAVDTEFQGVLDDFFHRRREYFAEQNKIVQGRVDEYERLIKQVKQLSWSNDLDASYQKTREIRNAWNAIGEVPPKKFFKINKAYRHFLKLFYDKYNLAKGIEPKVRVDPRILEQQKLLEQAEYALKNDNIVIASEKAKVLLSKWKDIRIPFKLADKELAENFRSTCDKIFELSYLARVISRKYPAFEMKSEEEQLRTQIREMEWLVSRERSDLEFATQDVERSLTGNEEEDKRMLGRLNIQKRKIAMKDKILREFQRKLDRLS